jgi:membrane protein implicated in regulation of membrane protease activity
MDTVQDWLKPQFLWFLAGLIMLILELLMPGLIIFFFGIGALVVAAICFFANISLNMQMSIFLAVSILLLLSLRQWIKKAFVGHLHSNGLLSEFTGEKAVVTKQIDPVAGGRVDLHGISWNAQAEELIPEGTIVEVIGKNNITLTVRKHISKEGVNT